jgi:uncharacterized protein (DUF1499 family)
MGGPPPPRPYRFLGPGLAVAGIALALLLLAGIGTRLDWWSFRTGFHILRYAAYAGIVAAGIGALALFLARHNLRRLVLSLVVVATGALVISVPLLWLQKKQELPAINDISTDMANPPAFVALAARRVTEGTVPSRYDIATAAAQRTAYPELAPRVFPVTPAAAFAAAVETAKALGWRLAAVAPEKGRIEATDTTFWFGFTDDVVVRIQPANGGSKARIDMRSTSRVGRHDFGVNTARIRRFFAALGKRLG